MSEPFPPVRPVRSCSADAAARSRAATLSGATAGGRRQHLPRLDADVGRVGGPLDPAGGDPVLGLGRAQVEALGADLGDGDGHGGVVGPLAGRPAERAAAGHADVDVVGQRWAELVAGAEGVTRGHGEQDAGGAVGLGGGQVQGHGRVRSGRSEWRPFDRLRERASGLRATARCRIGGWSTMASPRSYVAAGRPRLPARWPAVRRTKPSEPRTLRWKFPGSSGSAPDHLVHVPELGHREAPVRRRRWRASCTRACCALGPRRREDLVMVERQVVA